MSRMALWNPLVEAAEPLAEAGQGEKLLGVVAERVGRDHVEQRLDRLAHPIEVVAVLLVRIRVVGEMRAISAGSRRGPG